MKKLLESIIAELEQNHSLMLVSILASSGSTPRGAGAMMLVFEDGHTEGTIGGGTVEYAAKTHAQKLLTRESSDTVGYCLNKNDVASLGMICGGDVTVYFQYLKGSKELPVFLRLHQAYAKNEASWLVRRIDHHTVTSMAVCDQEGMHFGEGIDPALLPELLKPKAVFLTGEPSYCAEPVTQAGYVYIFGGGHVSQELVPVLSHVGFPVIVLEDRREFADPSLFPGAKEVILGDFLHLSDSVTLTEHDYAVIMTRGHQSDFEILAQVLKHTLSYVGCIGSRSKIAATKAKLTAMGFPETIYDQVHSPIGLDIRAETPAEIAISIAAELIRHRAALIRS
ncbi:MAG: XdhC family protein [Clostridiales bacterium]|nr:XdhC family protein [Clostridiales bacterium]